MEQGGLLTPNPGWEDDDPTGEAKAGLGRKCGKDAACTEVRAVGCGNDIGGYNIQLKEKTQLKTNLDKL